MTEKTEKRRHDWIEEGCRQSDMRDKIEKRLEDIRAIIKARKQNTALGERLAEILTKDLRDEAAWLEQELERHREEMRNDVVEMCPHCNYEVSLNWDHEKDGLQIFCPYCGETIMLCSMCDRENGCDWSEEGCRYSDERYNYGK